MDIITSHNHLDLDGLASMVAIQKLYPNAELVFSGNVNKNVKELTLLYQDDLNIWKSKDVDISRIKKIILVDTDSFNRIGKFKTAIKNQNPEIIIYDHHHSNENSKNYFYKKTGANTTFILEMLIEKGINEFKMNELNLFMMGIYEDTGSLSFTTTTPDDIKMAAFLLEKGADLEIVNNYITKTLQDKQMKVFLELIKTREIINFSIENVFLAKYVSDNFIDGFDVIANKIKDIENVSGVFLIYECGRKTYIIGRSSSLGIRVDEILEKFNGGGHSNAGSAVMTSTNIETIYEELKKYLVKNLKAGKLAEDIMKTPVKTCEIETNIKEVYKIMSRFGFNGIPITEKGKIVGIISRKDIDKAMSHGFGNAPAKAYMSSEVISAKKSDPIELLKKKIIENEIGRLPVLDSEENIIGIITRSDILRNLFEQRQKKEKKYSDNIENIKSLIKQRMPKDIYAILEKIREVSKIREEKAYLVGGIVRDIILGYENFDVDIVVEGDAIAFSKKFYEIIKGKKIVVHKKFNTAIVIFEDDLKIDFTSSRIEYYEYPTSLPVVEEGNIKQDLFRRDFTMNAMAIEIDYHNFGRLIDFFNGYTDIKNGKIRVLHNLSFIEDPTRIIRGIRFLTRYDFEFSKDTLKFIHDSLEKKMLENLTWKRTKYELKLILGEKNANKSIYLMDRFGVLTAIHKKIVINKIHIERVESYHRYIQKYNQEKWVIYFMILLENLNSDEIKKLLNRFAFSNKFISKHNYGKSKRNKIFQAIYESQKNSEIYEILSDFEIDNIIIFLVVSDIEIISDKIKLYLDKLNLIKPLVRGSDLVDIGYESGPLIGEKLKDIFVIQIDEGITKKEELLDKSTFEDIL